MTQMVPARDRVNNVRALLEKSKQQIAMALPKHMTSDRMLRVAMTEVQKTPLLLECTPMSLVGAVVQAAQLGLELGVLGQAYLVPFKGKVQLIPGYRGLVQLARRSGQIEVFEARVVHEKDTFEVGYGLDAKLRHVPYMAIGAKDDESPGRVIAAYAFARFKDGGYQFEVMSVRELEAIRKRSQAANNGPWVTDTEEMQRKTVAKRLCKWLPASIELASAVQLDNTAEAGLPQDLDVVDIEGQAVEADEGERPKPAPVSKLAAVTDALEVDGGKVCEHVAVPKQRLAALPVGKSIVCPDCKAELKREREAGEE